MAKPGGVRFEAAEVRRLFPAFVWKAQLAPGVYEPINAALLAEVAGLLPSPGVPPPATLWQSGHALHEREALAGFISMIETAIHEVLAFLKVGDHAFEITGCWANVSPPGGWHRMHSHPNNFLSGVHYVQVQDGTDTINFHDPRPQTGIIRPPVTELTAYNTDQVVVKVAVGALILFPAWLPHSVDPNTSGANRVSVSFNAMFTGFAERLAKPLWGER